MVMQIGADVLRYQNSKCPLGGVSSSPPSPKVVVVKACKPLPE
jgi:hypothetical protein